MNFMTSDKNRDLQEYYRARLEDAQTEIAVLWLTLLIVVAAVVGFFVARWLAS